jgi:outer membrane protein assembly factor BamC
MSLTPRLAVALLAACAAGCTWTGNTLNSKIDYQSARTRATPLEVPPDLSQLPRDERFAVPERPTTVTASGTAAAQGRPASAAGAPAVVTSAAVAPSAPLARIERDGTQRWLAVNMPPEAAWPILIEFWPSVGLAVEKSDPKTGVMETVWAENRAKVQQDVIRQTLGRVLGSVYSTGEQDKYRARVERTPKDTTEIFISHRGMQEVFTSSAQDRTAWQPRPPDPEMEAEMLQRLLLRFDGNAKGPTTAAAPAGAAAARPAAATTAATGAAATASGASGAATAAVAGATAPGAAVAKPVETAFIVKGADGRSERLDIDDPFDRAWRRVGLALDRGGFTVEDRDRAKGVYFVRYLDPDYETKQREQQGIFAKILRTDKPVQAPQYRVQLASAGDAGTKVTVWTADGKPEISTTGDRILALLRDQLIR